MKQVHWQLPFASLNGTQYRIDIYAEGAPVGGVKTLTGGATPFTTDEDNSDDFFEPVRSQTGTIRIVNTDGLLSIEDLLPQNDTDMPVCVIRKNGSQEIVEWMGFLSCEVYTQEYISIPHEIDINVNGILEAMKSVKMPTQPSFGIASLRWWFESAFKMNPSLELPYDLDVFMQNYITHDYIIDFDHKYTETQPLLDALYIQSEFVFHIEDKYMGNGYINRVAEGKSVYDFVSDICSFFGLTVRERGNTIYFKYCGDAGELYESSDWLQSMSSLIFKGIGHKISIYKGCNKITISSDVKDFGDPFSLPATPTEPTLSAIPGAKDFYDYVQAYQASQHSFSNIALNQCYANVSFTGSTCRIGRVITSAWVDPLNRSGYLGRSGAKNLIGDIATHIRPGGVVYSGACFAKIWLDNNGKMEDTDCLFAQFIPTPNLYSITNYGSPIAKITCPIASKYYGSDTAKLLENGIIRVKIDADYMGVSGYTTDAEKYEQNLNDHTNNAKFLCTVKIGSKYYIGTSSTPSPVENEFSIVLPSPVSGDWGNLGGQIELSIYPILLQDGWDLSLFNGAIVTEVAIKSIDVELDFTRNIFNEENSNRYTNQTGSSFEEDKELSLNLASYNNNSISPNLLYDVNNIYITKFDYHDVDDSTDSFRPEEELMNRMITYYSIPRRVIELEISHNTLAPLPLLQIEGYDHRRYLPLSESRDWKMDISTVKCFEMP